MANTTFEPGQKVLWTKAGGNVPAEVVSVRGDRVTVRVETERWRPTPDGTRLATVRARNLQKVAEKSPQVPESTVRQWLGLR